MPQTALKDLEGIDGSNSDFIAFLRGILELRWQILGVVLIFSLLAFLLVSIREPVFRAVTSVLIEYRQGSVLEGADVYETGAGAKSYYATQVNVLGSRDMASRAIARVDWSKYADVLTPKETVQRKIKNRFRSLLASASGESVAPEESAQVDDKDVYNKESLIKYFMASTRLVPVVNTQLVQVHFMSTSPELAAEAANALAEAYIDSGFEAQFEATKRATEWLNERLQGIRARLESSEKELQEFRESQDLVNIGGGRSVLEEQLADNMQRLRDAERQQTQLQNTYAKVRAAGFSDRLLQQVPSLLQDELVQRTKEIYLKSQNDIGELRTRYGPKHPTMIKAQARMREAETAFFQQLRRAADNIKTQYEIATRNVASLNAVVENTRREIRALDRQGYKLQILNRETDTNSQLYSTILKRFKAADIAGDFQPLKARIIDPAVVPNKPYLPNKRKSVMLAAALGLLVGIVLAALRNYLDTGIKTGDGLEQATGVPVFASIPASGRRFFGGAVSRLVESSPKTAFSEGLRTVRTGVLLADLDKKNKRVLVTSALPQEGKSSIATNLALAFSQVEKVLLLDCDLRKPSLAKYLGIKEAPVGLGELMQGKLDKASKAVQRVAPNVDLLSIGKEMPSPGQVLTSSRFREILDEVSQDYDRVIIDSAPCQPVSDSFLLANLVDGIVFVVRYDATATKIVQTSLKRLEKTQAPVLGLVLNRVDPKKAIKAEDSYYHGKGYYG